MTLKLTYTAPDYKRAMADALAGVTRATALATRSTARIIKQKGQADIARSGKFGARWQQGLIVEAIPPGGYQIDNAIVVGHTEVGADTFEHGGVIKGRPLLWIPLSFADPKARAKGYPGGLFRVDRKSGKPLLLSIRDKKPKFVGVRQVRIPQKWHLREISADAMARDFPTEYNRSLNVGGTYG